MVSAGLKGISPFALAASLSFEVNISHPLHKTIHHALLARLVELDGQLVAVDGGDVAVAELDVKHPVADCELRGAGGFGDQFAVDGQRFAARGEAAL